MDDCSQGGEGEQDIGSGMCAESEMTLSMKHHKNCPQPCKSEVNLKLCCHVLLLFGDMSLSGTDTEPIMTGSMGWDVGSIRDVFGHSILTVLS